jgi:uracil-DNA glycosylase
VAGHRKISKSMRDKMPNRKLSSFLNSNECTKCPEIVFSRSLVVKGCGDPHAKLMFVGMAPGRNGADITGVPFTRDPSGVLFQECMIYAGFSLESNPKCENPRLKDVYVTNLVKCNPKDENGNNRDPTIEEINNCAFHYERELAEINPQIIVLFGKIVTEHILKLKIQKFSDVHNVPINLRDRTYLPFIHPSYVIRGAYNRQKYVNEMVALKDLLKMNNLF